MTVPIRLRRAVVALVVLAGPILLCACDVRGTVRIDVAEDGSGVVGVTVALDAETVEALGDPAVSVVLSDLVAGGWTVAPARTTGDLTVLDASKSFGSPDDLASVLEEVGGVDGLFREVDLEVIDGFADTTYRLGGDIVSSGSLTDFGDAELAGALDGQPVGYSADELSLLVVDTDAHVRLDVEVTLPGADRVDTSAELAAGEPVETAFGTESTVRRSAPIFWLVAAAIAAVAATTLAVLVKRAGGGSGPNGPARPTAPDPG